MDKNSRSSLNPFTGKSHFDIINDDNFLESAYREYYKIINDYELLDNTQAGELVSRVSSKLIGAVEDYLFRIGRHDYIENYYDWEFHLVKSDTVNAFCMPGGKIVVFSGILDVANTEERLAFIVGHEMAHALLDHSRTSASQATASAGITTAAWLGGLALDILGNHEAGSMVRAASNVAAIGSEFLLLKPYGRQHEIEADKLGIMMTHLAGYNIDEIPIFWQDMSNISSNNHDFFSTHPTDAKRIEAMREAIWKIETDNDFYNKPLLADDSSKSYTIKGENTGSTMNLGIGSHAPVSSFTSSNKSKTKFCNMCGNPVGVDDAFCTNCGHKLSSDLKCAKCGASVGIHDSFCTQCGNKL